MEQERKINTVIECKGVSKIFDTPEGKHEVVRGLNFAARENEFLVLFGPGQCGKTTIINMIAGFEQTTGETITASGKMVGPAGRLQRSGISVHFPLPLDDSHGQCRIWT